MEIGKQHNIVCNFGPRKMSKNITSIAMICFPTNQEPANFWGTTEFQSEYAVSWNLFGFQIPRFPDSWISRFPGFQAPAPVLSGAGRSRRSQLLSLYPSPNARRDQIHHQEPGALAAINSNEVFANVQRTHAPFLFTPTNFDQIKSIWVVVHAC